MIRVICGDCREVMAGMDAASVESIVCDPPYGLAFMGKAWDHGVPGVPFWTAALRVAKPGAHLLAFGGTRTHHRLACAIEDAGWEIRDCLMWLYGTGFPKSHNLKGQWAGWGTALKPAWEPIIMARKPLVGTVAANVLEHGTGAVNVDGCRVGTEEVLGRAKGGWLKGGYVGGKTPQWNSLGTTKEGGRWPANLILDEQAGQIRNAYGDTGGPSRFFYCAKASKAERGEGNTHPTVKPIALMRYLCRLVTPPGGTVLDPFAGSGSTLLAAQAEGFAAIGIEIDETYLEICKARLRGTGDGSQKMAGL